MFLNFRVNKLLQEAVFRGYKGTELPPVPLGVQYSPLIVQRDLGRLHVGVLPLHLWAVHEVAEGVKGLGLPVQ